jgi:hypothetical protein
MKGGHLITQKGAFIAFLSILTMSLKFLRVGDSLSGVSLTTNFNLKGLCKKTSMTRVFTFPSTRSKLD